MKLYDPEENKEYNAEEVPDYNKKVEYQNYKPLKWPYDGVALTKELLLEAFKRIREQDMTVYPIRN
jgi:hypothetical protein